MRGDVGGGGDEHRVLGEEVPEIADLRQKQDDPEPVRRRSTTAYND
jgi:hypothetical protein